jgi:hypothetical protein
MARFTYREKYKKIDPWVEYGFAYVCVKKIFEFCSLFSDKFTPVFLCAIYPETFPAKMANTYNRQTGSS